MIYSIFPCTGKSTIVSTTMDVIDLESSVLFVNDKRPDNWVDIYINIADLLSKQGFRVLLSSHKKVRDALSSRNIKFISIYPSKDLKNHWIDKLKSRYENIPTDKNKRALEYVLSNYDSMVDDMSHDPNSYCIEDKYYDLKNVLNVSSYY